MAISLQTSQYLQPPVTNPSGLARGTRSQIRQDVQSLSTALQSGDLAGAQKSFGDLQKLLQSNGSISQATTSSPASAATPSSPLDAVKSDFQALGQALSSGDLAGAQKDYAQLASDSQQIASQQAGAAGGAGKAGGHHHHHAKPAGVDSDGDSDGSGSPSTSATSSTSGTSSSPANPATGSVSNLAQTFGLQANANQAASFQQLFQIGGYSIPSTSTDPTAATSQTSPYQFPYQAASSSQSVSYLA